MSTEEWIEKAKAVHGDKYDYSKVEYKGSHEKVIIICKEHGEFTPLEDNSIDIAVFSLALWGTNYEDYFKEAYRVLTYDGLMYIAEPLKSYNQERRNELLDMLKQNGFALVDNIEERGKFFYITVIKK